MWNGKKKALTFSYDDGVLQDVRFIEMLDKYGMKGTFNLNSGMFGKQEAFPHSGVMVDHSKVNREDVREIYRNHEIAVHTINHLLLPSLTKEEVIYQVEQDRLELSELAGYEIIGMAYPCGGENNNDEVAKIIKENTGVKYSRTITSTGNFDLQDNLFRFNPSVYHLHFDDMFALGEKFLKFDPEKPQLFYVWGHTYEFDIEDTWDKMEEFLKMMSRKDDIFYGTNREILL